MKVYVLPADVYGCGHYRLIWPADVLRSAGHDIMILPPDERSGFFAKIKEDPATGEQTLISLRVPEDADVVVMQRPARPLQVQMVRMMRANGIAVVIDMDDDMSTLHPKNLTYRLYHPRSNSGMSWKWAQAVCDEATLVTTSTKTLQNVYARHGRGVVIDNYVPEAYLGYHKYPSGRFGWAGTTKSHPDDLQVTGRAAQHLIDFGYRFTVVGGESGVKDVLRLKEPVHTCGPVGLEAWARSVCQEMDVAWCPLSATAFNRSKSRLKPIESMAVGIPWIGSPREEYRRVHKESGVGFLAETPKDWLTITKRLMDSEELRTEQGEAGREWMRDQTYQKQAWRQWEAWEHALKLQRG